MAEKKIQDFGEKIGGARKDVWRHRGLTLEDIESFNIREMLEHVIKKNVWVEPQWKKLVKEGYDPEALYIIKHIRDKIPSKPSVDADGAKWLITKYGEEEATTMLMKELGEWIESVRTWADAALSIIKTKEDCDENLKGKISRATKGCKVKFDIWAMELDNKMEIKRKFFEAKVQKFPESFRGDLKGLRVSTYYNQEKAVVCIGKNKIKEFDTVAKAVEWCLDGSLIELLDKEKNTKKVSKIVKVVRPQLEHIERMGPDLRGNVNVTGDDILEKFAFRGGEFGNWNTDDDRQACLNYVYDALQDLCYCLNVESDFIGFGKNDQF